MYFLILVKEVVELSIGNIPFNWLTGLVLAILLLLTCLGLVGFFMEIKSNEARSTKVKIVEANNTTDRHFLGYFSLFVLFAVTFDLSRLSMFVVFIIIQAMIGVVYVKNKLFFINPFLNIMGFNFYKITYLIDGQKKSTHIFYRGAIELGKEYQIKIKDENFSFISK